MANDAQRKATTTQVHGTCVRPDSYADFGVLLYGPVGSGKSDLALRLIDRGAALVADDQVRLTARDGVLVASCPGPIASRLEIRGVGIVEVPSAATARLALVAELAPGGPIPRFPEPRLREFLGISVPTLFIDPFEVSAAAKVRWAVKAFAADLFRHEIDAAGESAKDGG